MNWTSADNKNFKLHAESPVTKIYIYRNIEEFEPEYRPFEIFHPRPNTIKIYRKLHMSLTGEDKEGSTNSNKTKEDEDIMD